MVVSAWALPILDKLGGQDNASAWFKFTVIFGAVSAVIFILSAMSVKMLMYTIRQQKCKNREKGIFFKRNIFSYYKKQSSFMCTYRIWNRYVRIPDLNSLRMYFFKYNMGGRTDLITYIGYASTFVGFALVAFIQPFVKRQEKEQELLVLRHLQF